MKIHKRAVAIVVVALGAVMALGGWAIASAQTPAPKAPAVSQSSTSTQSTSTDTDNVRAGDQSTPDTVSETNSAESETTSEKTGAEEPGDQNLPGGGHADPAGDVQHEFDGVE